eukprot:1161813-Pelagomonas_calceolata.AAC.13
MHTSTHAHADIQSACAASLQTHAIANSPMRVGYGVNQGRGEWGQAQPWRQASDMPAMQHCIPKKKGAFSWSCLCGWLTVIRFALSAGHAHAISSGVCFVLQAHMVSMTGITALLVAVYDVSVLGQA